MNKLKELLKSLEGKRTYIVAIIMAVLNLAVACGWIPSDHLDTINMLLTALGLGTLRAGIKKA